MYDRTQFDEWSPVSRRQALLGIGAVAASGSGLAVVGTQQASGAANVSVDSFSVSDAEFEAESAAPVVELSVAYNYDVGNSGVSGLLFELVVGDSVVASDELTTDRTALSNTTDLSGRVTDSDGWDSADFAPAVGESVSRDVSVAVRFAVLDSTGDAIVEDSATDSATVTVTHPRDSRLVAEVGGDGVIVDGGE